MTNLAKISIIIPVLNEASTIKAALAIVQAASNIEVIVVDGGSEDETVAIAKSLNVKALFSPPGRAHQMNTGAAAATGDILLFLHADTRLPEGFDTMIRQTLQADKPIQNPTSSSAAARSAIQHPIAGAFELGIDGEMPSLRLIEKMVNWRSRYFQLPYGDQAIFLKTAVFHELGGFPELPIMEDFELSRQLRRLGRIEILPAAVLTSGRRWQKLGVFKTTLINQLIVIGYFVGVSPDKLAYWYRRQRK
jgi:glycosyltransferase involved in cell wall biosynthesis